MKSFKPKGGPGDGPPPGGGGRNAYADFHGETQTNATHASTTDPDARLIRQGRGKEAKLCHMGHLLMENRSGLIGRHADAGLRHRRTRGAPRHARPAGGAPPGDARRRQGLRRPGVRRRRPCPERHAAHRPEHQPPFGDRPPDDGPPRLRGEATAQEANRGRVSAGSRPPAASARPGTAAPPGSAGCSRSPPPPATWCASRSCWR